MYTTTAHSTLAIKTNKLSFIIIAKNFYSGMLFCNNLDALSSKPSRFYLRFSLFIRFLCAALTVCVCVRVMC